jgi:hypothetical protein
LKTNPPVWKLNPHGILTLLIYYQQIGRGNKIPWIGGSKTPWTVVEIWKGGKNTIGRGFKIAWIVGSKYNG